MNKKLTRIIMGLLATVVMAFTVATNVSAAAPTIVLDEGQWNENYSKEWVPFVQTWLDEHEDVTSDELKVLVEEAMLVAMNKAITDGVVPTDFNWGDIDNFGEWSGVLKLEIKNGDHTADIFGRKHSMLTVSAASLKEDGSVEVFLMINDLFVTWNNNNGFDGVGYPTTAPFVFEEELYQNFSKGYVDGSGNFVVDKKISTQGDVTNIIEDEDGEGEGEVEPPVITDYTGKFASDHEGKPFTDYPAYNWVFDLGIDKIETAITTLYGELAAAGIDFGTANEGARLWSAAGDGSGGAEETNWVRQEFTGGIHTAYLWNRVHGYIFVNRSGEAFAVYNDILLEWHGGWSDKGGPIGNPFYVEVEVNGETKVDVYQNFANVYVYVPDGDRSLVAVVNNKTITEAEALENTNKFYGIGEETPGVTDPDPTDPVEPTEPEAKSLTWLYVTLGVVAVAAIGAGVFVVIRKRS